METKKKYKVLQIKTDTITFIHVDIYVWVIMLFIGFYMGLMVK